MKTFKFILLAITLLLGGNAWADGISYTEVNAAAGKMIQIQSYYKGGNCIYVNGANVQVSTAQSDSRFILETAADGGFYLKHKDTGKYAGRTPNGSSQAVPAVEGTETAGRYTFEQATPDCNPASGSFNKSTTCVYVKCLNPNNSSYPAFHYAGSGSNVINWDGNHSGGGNAWVVTLIEDVPTVPVGPSAEEIQALQEKIDDLTPVIGKVGYPSWEASVTTALLPYNSNYGKVNAENYETAEAALEAYYNSTDVVLPEADKYYEIKAVYHDGTKKYLGFDGTKLSITDEKPMGGSVTFKAVSVTDNNVVLSIADQYVHWTSGDDKGKSADTDGLNETLSDLNTLTLTKATTGSSTTMATTEKLFGLFQIQGKSSGDGSKPKYNGQTFYFTTRSNGIFIAGESTNKFFDNNWNSDGTMRSSYFEITEVEAPAVDVPATAEEIESAQQLLWNADRLGYPKGDDSVVAALNDAVYKTGVTATELGAAVLAYKNCTNVVLPEKNRFYRLFGSSTNNVLAGGSHLASATMLSGVNPYQGPTEMDLATLYYYSEEGYLINYNGGLALKGAQLVLSSETPDVFTFCHETLTDLGTLSIKNANGTYLFDQNHNVSTVGTPVGPGTNWEVYEYGYAPIRVGSSCFATAYMPFGLAANPEYGIKGVYVAYEDGDVLKAESLNFIPAKIPVIIETFDPNTTCFGKGYGEDNYTVDAELQAKLDANVLAGSLIAMAKPENALVLGIADEVLGFYSLNGTVLNGFKAYYPHATLSSNGIALRFDDTLTAIESAVETAQGHQIFDLQGRRVNGAVHGLFIQNGKKVIK